jgi:hypothetical protein
MEPALGKEHLNTLMSMKHLADVLRHQGKYEEVEEMHRQPLKSRETVLEKGDPDTLVRMNNSREITTTSSSTTSRRANKYEELKYQPSRKRRWIWPSSTSRRRL